MKRNLLFIIIITLTACGVVLIDGCQKNDTTPPVVFLYGASTVHISLNSTYHDAGAYATDNADGTDVVTSDWTDGNPNVNVAGTYIINYSATDNAGNTGRLKRTVIVANDAQNIAGNYSVNDNISGTNAGTYSYTVYVTASTTHNRQLLLADFSKFPLVTVIGVVSDSGDTLTLASQNPPYMPDPGAISGMGAIAANNITGVNYYIQYASGGGTDTGVSTWTKQ